MFADDTTQKMHASDLVAFNQCYNLPDLGKFWFFQLLSSWGTEPLFLFGHRDGEYKFLIHLFFLILLLLAFLK